MGSDMQVKEGGKAWKKLFLHTANASNLLSHLLCRVCVPLNDTTKHTTLYEQSPTTMTTGFPVTLHPGPWFHRIAKAPHPSELPTMRLSPIPVDTIPCAVTQLPTFSPPLD